MLQVVWAGSKGVAFRWKPLVSSKGKMVVSEPFPHTLLSQEKEDLGKMTALSRILRRQ